MRTVACVSIAVACWLMLAPSIQGDQVGGGQPMIDDLLKDLESPRVAERKAAAVKLGDIGNKDATEPLLRLLGDTDNQVQLAAVEALGRLRDPRAVQPLCGLVDHRIRHKITSDGGALLRAAELSLGRIGDPAALDCLIRATQLPSGREAMNTEGHAVVALASTARTAAVIAMGWIRSPKAVPTLLEILKTQPRGEAQQYTLLALRRIGDERAVPPLLRIVQDTSRNPNEWHGDLVQVVVTLARVSKNREAIAPSLISLYEACGEGHGFTKVLADVAGKNAGPLLMKQLEKRKDGECIEALGNIRYSKAVPLLIQIARENASAKPQMAYRIAAIRALGALGDPQGETTLRGILRDEVGQVKLEAAASLAQLNETSGTQLIMECIRDVKRAEPYQIRALGCIKESDKILGEVYLKGQGFPRLMAAEILISRGVGIDRDVLISVASSKDPGMKEEKSEAVRLLGLLREPRALPIIEEVLRTEPLIEQLKDTVVDYWPRENHYPGPRSNSLIDTAYEAKRLIEAKN